MTRDLGTVRVEDVVADVAEAPILELAHQKQDTAE